MILIRNYTPIAIFKIPAFNTRTYLLSNANAN
ncbi:MAG: hypothetical protein RIQ59_953 [Bacteroidota bacterium]|jgi:hypothetical protein